MMNMRETTLYLPGISPETIIISSFIAINIAIIVSLTSEIRKLTAWDPEDYREDRVWFLFDGSKPAANTPNELLDLSKNINLHSNTLFDSNLIDRLSSVDALRLHSSLSHLRLRLDELSDVVERVLYIPDPEYVARGSLKWSQREPVYREAYELLRTSFYNIGDFVDYLVSSGSFDPTILAI